MIAPDVFAGFRPAKGATHCGGSAHLHDFARNAATQGSRWRRHRLVFVRAARSLPETNEGYQRVSRWLYGQHTSRASVEAPKPNAASPPLSVKPP